MSRVPVVGLDHVLLLGIALFGLGLFTVLSRRSAAGALCGAALMIQAAGLQLVAFHHFRPGHGSPAGLVLPALLAAASGAYAAVSAAVVLVARRRRT